jgi:hypothetical protein
MSISGCQCRLFVSRDYVWYWGKCHLNYRRRQIVLHVHVHVYIANLSSIGFTLILQSPSWRNRRGHHFAATRIATTVQPHSSWKYDENTWISDPVFSRQKCTILYAFDQDPIMEFTLDWDRSIFINNDKKYIFLSTNGISQKMSLHSQLRSPSKGVDQALTRSHWDRSVRPGIDQSDLGSISQAFWCNRFLLWTKINVKVT